ncbi:MAG TPA: hypothetical protein VIU61_11485, partial [Kofleriaceae bacterium]
MIASRLGLGIAIAIAAVLALVLAVTGAPERETADPALVPGFDPTATSELRWPEVRVARDPKSPTGWSLAGAPADARAVEDVLATLRGARWHRRGAAALAGPITHTLEVIAKAPLAIQIGAPLGDEQQWLVIGKRALLVDAWVA